jgi:acyl-CoA thioester hydrolase
VEKIQSRLRVRYKETDRMGVVHHANYLAWFEIGRTDLCRVTGVTYRQIEERGFLLLVTEVTCRYRLPYTYDDEVLIETYVADAASRMLRFGYELRDASGETLHASGSSSHLWVDGATRRPVRPPDSLMKPFRELATASRTSP